MRRWIAAWLCLAVSSSASAQEPVQLRIAACDATHARFAALDQVLRVELRGSDRRELGSGGAQDRLEVRIDDCAHPERVVLLARRGGHESSTEIELSEAHDAVAVRTVALLLVDLWRALVPPEEPAVRISEALPVRAAQESRPGAGHRLAAPRSSLAYRLGAPHEAPTPSAAPDAATSGVHPAPSLSIFVAGGFDGSYRLDGPGLLPGGRISLSLRHESGFVGRVALSFEGTQGSAVGTTVDLLAPWVELQGGGELVVDQLALGVSAGARAGVVTASVQEPASARTEIEGLLDIALSVRARWQFHPIVGAEIESGIGYAVMGHAGTTGSGLVLPWREWWVPIRASLTLRLQ